MNYGKFNLERILLVLSLFLYIKLQSEESSPNSPIIKGDEYPVGSRARIRMKVTPIYSKSDLEYFESEDEYSGCIPYYYHYGYPPSAFNFGLRMRGGKSYYYCPRGYYYKRSRYKHPHHRRLERKHAEHKH